VKALMLLVLMLSFGISAAYSEAEERIEKGRILFRTGRVNEALEEFRSLEREGYASALMDYNIGVAAHRAGKKGLAVLHLMRAAARYPLDRSITAKLSEVRESGVEFDSPLSLTASIDSIRLMALAALIFTAVGIAFSKGSLIAFGVACNFLILPVLLLAEFSIQKLSLNSQIVIPQVDKLALFSAPDSQSQVVALGGEGSEFTALQVTGDWIQVALSSGRKGWIRKGPEIELFGE